MAKRSTKTGRKYAEAPIQQANPPIQPKDQLLLARLLNKYGPDILIEALSSEFSRIPPTFLSDAHLAEWIEQRRLELAPRHKRGALKLAISDAFDFIDYEKGKPPFPKEYERLKKLHKRGLNYIAQFKAHAALF